MFFFNSYPKLISIIMEEFLRSKYRKNFKIKKLFSSFYVVFKTQISKILETFESFKKIFPKIINFLVFFRNEDTDKQEIFITTVPVSRRNKNHEFLPSLRAQD